MDTQTQINELKQEIDNLKRSSSIPRDTETAFRERLDLPTEKNYYGFVYKNTSLQWVLSGYKDSKNWTVVNDSTGYFTITHNLGSNRFNVCLTPYTEGAPSNYFFGTECYNGDDTTFKVRGYYLNTSGGIAPWSNYFMFILTLFK